MGLLPLQIPSGGAMISLIHTSTIKDAASINFS